jgi:hypothetical protein
MDVDVDSKTKYLTYVPSAIHETFVCPIFASSTHDNLNLLNFSDMLCERYNGVHVDKNGSSRSLRTVKGCYANTLNNYNISLDNILNWPEKSYFSDTLRPSIVILNGGSDTLKTATIEWELDGVRQIPVQWTGKLPFCPSEEIS